MFLQLLENIAIEDSCLIYIGNLFIHFYPSIESKINLKVLELSMKKLFSCELPSLIKTLISMFSRFLLLDQNNLLNILNTIKIENQNGLVILLEKWLSYLDYFEEKILKNLTFMALASLLKYENIYFNNPYLSLNYSQNDTNYEENFNLKIFCNMILFLHQEINLNENIHEKSNIDFNLNYSNSDEMCGYPNNQLVDNYFDDLMLLDDMNLNIDLKVK